MAPGGSPCQGLHVTPTSLHSDLTEGAESVLMVRIEIRDLFPIDNRSYPEDTIGMPTYELTFATPDIEGPEDPRLDLLEGFDAIASSHSGLTTVTVLATGEHAMTAAVEAIRALSRAGIGFTRLVPDLVDRAEIAERTGKTRQAVGNWVRGERRTGVPFPAPYANDMWLWGDLTPWLSATSQYDDLVSYPSIEEHTAINAYITRSKAFEQFGGQPWHTTKHDAARGSLVAVLSATAEVMYRDKEARPPRFQRDYALAGGLCA